MANEQKVNDAPSSGGIAVPPELMPELLAELKIMRKR
jgi:hypothetical protein